VHHSQVAAATLEMESASNDTAEKARTSSGRLQRGLRTPEAAYYQSILRALDGLGGRAKMNDILDRVEQLMHEKLATVDYQPLNSDPEVPRWRNAAQWARNAMVKEGLLKDDSPRGVWEISEAGRHALAAR
jgi:restriction system protein